MFFVLCSGHHRVLHVLTHSFPTRRAADRPAALESAAIIVMLLAPGSQSPISLLETGLHARGGKLILLCPEGFWRKGNVDITAERYRLNRSRRWTNSPRRCRAGWRSEEHPSELQSLMRLSSAVFCVHKNTSYTLLL